MLAYEKCKTKEQILSVQQEWLDSSNTYSGPKRDFPPPQSSESENESQDLSSDDDKITHSTQQIKQHIK